ncbi:hypothetical protein PV325_010373 [Microctonus aethiopoides]|nr:hypothetical protein PV325_010373 [Microctonus aethiopoides]
MPKKITRSDRHSSGSRLYRPRKIAPPHKRQSECIATSSASAKKIRVAVEDQVTEDFAKHYRIIDFLLVFSTIATLVKRKALDLTSECRAKAVNKSQWFRLVQE